jgi:hypothetical protein
MTYLVAERQVLPEQQHKTQLMAIKEGRTKENKVPSRRQRPQPRTDWSMRNRCSLMMVL